jgi:hypothetical protein
MKTFTLDQVEHYARQRDEAWKVDLLTVATAHAGMVRIAEADWLRLWGRPVRLGPPKPPVFNPAPARPLDPPSRPSRDPINPTQWPKWARAIAMLKTGADTGVGDTAERLATAMGGKAYKAFRKSIGLPCKCAARKADWNARYSYSLPLVSPATA